MMQMKSVASEHEENRWDNGLQLTQCTYTTTTSCISISTWSRQVTGLCMGEPKLKRSLPIAFQNARMCTARFEPT